MEAAPRPWTTTFPGPKGAPVGEALPLEVALFGWRGAVGEIDGQGAPDLVVAFGGDLAPQPVVAFLGNRQHGLIAASYIPRFDPQRTLAGDRPGFHSQVRLAPLTGRPDRLDVVVSTYQGSRRFPHSRTDGSGLVIYGPEAAARPDLLDEAMTGTPLICGVQVNDFLLFDQDGDGLLDVLVAGRRGDPAHADCDAPPSANARTRRGDRTPPAPPARRRGDGLTPGRRTGAARLPHAPFLGLYLNRGTATAPRFATAPDWWVRAPGRSAPSRVALADVDLDGHADIVAAFIGWRTVVLPGAAPLPKSGSTLGADVPGLPADSRMTVDIAAWTDRSPAFCPAGAGRADGCTATIVAESRTCSPGDTRCPAGTPATLRIQVLPAGGEPAVREIPLGPRSAGLAPFRLDDGTPAVLVDTCRSGFGDCTLEARPIAAPGTRHVVLEGRGLLLDLVPFQDAADAPERRWTAPTPGPFVPLPAPGVVAGVTVDGEAIPACAPGASRCHRLLPGLRALQLVGVPIAEPATRPVVLLRAFDYDHFVLVSADPFTKTTVLWHGRGQADPEDATMDPDEPTNPPR